MVHLSKKECRAKIGWIYGKLFFLFENVRVLGHYNSYVEQVPNPIQRGCLGRNPSPYRQDTRSSLGGKQPIHTHSDSGAYIVPSNPLCGHARHDDWNQDRTTSASTPCVTFLRWNHMPAGPQVSPLDFALMSSKKIPVNIVNSTK